MQDYNINLTMDFLKSISIRKFLMYLKGFTKNTAIGNFIMMKNLEKSKSNSKNKISFDTSNKNSMKMFMNLSKELSNG